MSSVGEVDEGAKGAGWRDLVGEGRGALAALLLLGIWLNAADALVTTTLMPSAAQQLGGYAYMAWATGGFMLGGIVAAASSGFLANRLGLRRALMVGGGAYLVGCVASAAAPNIAIFLVGRLAQGVGAGWIVGLCFVVIGVVFRERVAVRMFAALSGVWGAATLLGPLVGGVFATVGLWRWAFWAFAAQSAVFVWGALALLPTSARTEGEEGAPWLQLALVAAGVFLIALAGVRPWGEAIALLVLGVAVLAGVPLVDRRARARLLPEAATRVNSRSAAGYAAIFLLSLGTVAHTVYSPILLQRIHGITPLVAGYVVTAEAMGWSFTAMAIGAWAVRFQGGLIRAGAIVVAVGQFGLALSVGQAPLLAVAASAAVMGSGFGMSFAFMSSRIIEGLEESQRALASAAVPTVQTLGGAVGAALSGVAGGVLGLGRPFGVEVARHAAFPLFASFVPLMVLGVLAAWRLGASAQRFADAAD